MSAESAAGSRPPQTDSANESETGASAAETDKSDSALSDLPTPKEKTREFLDEMGALAHQEVSEEHGRPLRPECFEEEKETFTVSTEDGGEIEEERVVSREAVPLYQAVGNMLEWHADYHRSALRLEYGRERDFDHEILTVNLENSWMAAYQKQERARLKALERETCGYQLCQGGECDTRWCQEPEDHPTRYVGGEFEEPVVVLTGRTASGRDMAPADHAREIAETFSYGGVRRSLRYVMDKLGLESDEWVRWTQGEPHTSKRAGEGYGTNTGYDHNHDIIILDESAVAGEVSAGDFREVIETHVAECEGAGREAHDLDVADWDAAPETAECDCESGCGECVGTVTVKKVDEEIEESVASYAAAYLANESKDLLERSPEYLAWAATMWATGTQKATGTDSRTHAIDADRCKHKYHAADEDQDLRHGEEVVQERVRGSRRIVCLACGSPWGIDQDQTLASARTGGATAAADGGREYGPKTRAETVEQDLRERWPSARSAASVGGPTAVKECDHEEPNQCPLCAESVAAVSNMTAIPESAEAPDPPPSVSVGFERPPRWRATAVIRDGEEYPASGGGTDREPLKLRDAPEVVAAMAVRGPGVTKCMECGMTFDTPRAYAEHGCDGGEVGVGWLAPTDPPAEESRVSRERFLAAVPDRHLEGDDQGDGPGGEVEGGADPARSVEAEVAERVAEYVADRPEVGVVEVMGRLTLSPSEREVVSEVVSESGV
jgi:hypothetical protein